MIKAYQLYLEQCAGSDLEPLLSVTRAWRLVKFVETGMLKTRPAGAATATSSCATST